MMDSMLRAGLDIGKDVVRGDVQTRLFGGVEEAVDRLVRFSDVAMIMCGRGQDESDGEFVSEAYREAVRGCVGARCVNRNV
jgi:hypothetical protein